MEVSGFNRYEISGEGVEEFLDRMTCGRLPTETGKVSLCYLLTEKGNVLSEATLVKLGENRYWWGSAAAAEWHDRDWLNRFKPDSVTITEMAGSHTILVVAGPKSRALLQSVSPRGDWSKAAFLWLRCQQMFIGHAKVTAMSVSFSGELAYELHVPNEQLYLVWKILNQAGKAFDLGVFGLYATESMRLEKGYLHWKTDLICEHNPFETRLERFVNLDKTDFIGKQALLEQVERGPRKLLVSMTVDCDIASAHGGDPVFADGRQVGSVTSAGYGHRVQKNIAYAYVNPDMAKVGTGLKLGILGDKYAAVVTDPILYDPENHRVRA
jgi:dimethylglycine dehydrogenase